MNYSFFDMERLSGFASYHFFRSAILTSIALATVEGVHVSDKGAQNQPTFNVITFG